jgi:hypothetical protein
VNSDTCSEREREGEKERERESLEYNMSIFCKDMAQRWSFLPKYRFKFFLSATATSTHTLRPFHG